jgi:glycosyltransferase involved in cell wall biosynthesis
LAAELKAKHQRSPLVVFLGQIDTPIRYFRCFDMGIFPSTFVGETFPLFLLECFQAELPVISTDIGGIRGMMEAEPERLPGLLVEHHCETAILASRFVTMLRHMFDSPADYDAYRVGTVAASRRYSIESLGNLYAQTFQELVPGRSYPINEDERTGARHAHSGRHEAPPPIALVK